MTAVTLNRYRANGALPGLLAEFAAAVKLHAKDSFDAVVLASSPAHCRFARLRPDDGAEPQLDWGEKGFAMRWGDMFELRAFCDAAEFRWLRDADGSGRAAWLAEAGGPTPSWGKADKIEAVETLPRRYLLWGKWDPDAKDVPAGWTVLSAARVGRLWLPINLDNKPFARLAALEYVAVDADDGIAFVAEERLTDIRPYEPTEEAA
jgi:CRISPR-associated protein (TIGR03984 family)